MKEETNSALETNGWSRRRLIRVSAVTLGGLTVATPNLFAPAPAQAWAWVVLRPFLKEIAVAIGASVIGSVVTEYLIKPHFRRFNNIPDSAGEQGREMLVENNFSEFEDTPEVLGTAPSSGAARGAGVYEQIDDVIFGGLNDKSPNGCANFMTHVSQNGRSQVSSVMIEGPTITGIKALVGAYRRRVSDDPLRVRDAIIPVEEIKPDLGRFEKSYEAEHRTRAGVISTSYRREPGSSQGLVTVSLSGKDSLQVNQELSFEPELYKA